ncbi:hypothetical protein CAEBREN_00194 [Caenorhabditis brenneri]|uniref:F-box domain-containing protein n=1 Tax=Caenorhabditis brenneri TaxID=135651 RepID=G0N3N5_CAEBE|nr:hypothetical protein CAEBREN_00194 [Caenorhabditis brenneri]
MSSLALVPFTFSLLKLPFIALQNVADYLNPYEIYHFSRISKKTNILAKVFSKKATRIYLISPFCVLIDYQEKGDWSIEPNIEPGPDSYKVDRKNHQPIYAYFSKKPASEALRVLERVVDVFKCSIIYLQLNTRSSRLRRQDLTSYFDWFTVNPSEVPYVYLKCKHGADVQCFIENYKKPSDELDLIVWGERGRSWPLNRELLELPDNLETNLFKKVKIISYKPANLNLYNIFSSPVIDSVEHQLPDSYLNTFLKNWQSGLTNPNWKSVCISVPRQTNLINILDGITATYRDPRTVKRQINVDKESFWIFGGIDIENHDGSATATVQWKKYKMENEDSEVPNELIEEYERNQESGEVQHVEQVLQGIVEQLLASSTFSMYIW